MTFRYLDILTATERHTKDRLITIVSRLYNEMNKQLYIVLHTQAWRSILNRFSNVLWWINGGRFDFLCNADMHMKKKKRNLTRISKEHAIKDDI